MATFAEVLGYGISTPFRRGPRDFATSEGVQYVQECMGNILGTRAGSQYSAGELPWRQSFGSLVHLILHQNNTQVAQELARIWTTEALSRWLPQVRVRDVRIEKKKSADGERNIMAIFVIHDIIGAGNRVIAQNQTFSTTVT